MIPQKRLLFGLISLAVSAAASSASAQSFLGSSVEDAKRLLPAEATPIPSVGSGEEITYRDLKMGDVTWSQVTLRFDSKHKLASLSLQTHALSYDALRARAMAQLQVYAAYEVQQQALMGTVAVPTTAPMQIRLCAKGDEVEMTYERESQNL